MADKNNENNENRTVRMKRQIGLIGGVSMLVGQSIGSGIFVTPGGLLEKSESVGISLLVWLACGLLSTLAALTYCELGVVVPRSGGEHAYFIEAYKPLHPFFGELPAFLFALVNSLLLRPSSLAVVSLTFATYAMKPFLDMKDACEYWKDDSWEYDMAVRLLGGVCVLFGAFINSYSVKIATRIQIIFTAGKLMACLLIIIIGIVNMVQGKFGDLKLGFDNMDKVTYGGIALAFYSGLFTYDGWNNVNYLTEELVDPNKNLPRAIMIGIPIVTVAYCFINVSYLTVLSKDTIINSEAVAIDFGNEMLGPLKLLPAILVALSTLGSSNGTQFSAGRINYAAGREGHTLDILSYVHAKRLTPFTAIILNATMAIIMIIISDINTLVDIFSFTAWIFYALALASIFILRKTKPDANRSFKVPLIIPAIAFTISLYLIVAPIISDPKIDYLYPIIFLLFGTIIYYPFIYKKYNPPFMHIFSRTMQKITFVAPSPYKLD